MRIGWMFTFATPEMLSELAAIDHFRYPPDDVVPVARTRTWLARNPECFRVLRDGEGRLLGCLTIVPLVPGVEEMFRRGVVTESTLREADVAPPSAQSYDVGYIASIAAVPESVRPRAGLLLLYATRHWIVESSPRFHRFLAWPSTAMGQKLVQSLGFLPLHEPPGRREELWTASWQTVQHHFARLVPVGAE